MITYKFITQDKSQDMEAMSLKKAMISFNTKAGDAKEVLVEWKSRKGNVSFYKYKLPYVSRKERKGKL
jgi:hypothetical protein|tara:strand:- start:198 stop:401 length:204 start_codon:yes stop_codon:yes gene_type:complete